MHYYRYQLLAAAAMAASAATIDNVSVVDKDCLIVGDALPEGCRPPRGLVVVDHVPVFALAPFEDCALEPRRPKRRDWHQRSSGRRRKGM